MRELIFLIIGLLVGYGICVFVSDHDERFDELDKKLALLIEADGPETAWPMTPCPPPDGATVQKKLNEITSIALNQTPAIQLKAFYCAFKAQLLQMMPPTALPGAVASVKAAHAAATLAVPDWDTCRVELDGIH